MTKAKGKMRIERGIVDKAEKPTSAEKWEPVVDGRAETVDYPIPVGTDGRHQMFVQLIFFEGRLQRFVIAHRTLRGGEWKQVARVDCAHDSVHLDVLNRREQNVEKEVIMPITCEADVEAGYDAGYKMLEDRIARTVRTGGRNE
jgi:hypothetical protein